MSDFLNEDDYSYKQKYRGKLYWLRWILFIPAALLMSTIITSISNFLEHEFSFKLNSITQVILLAVSSALLIATAKFVAPSHKKIVGRFVVLAFTVAAILIISTIVVTYKNNNNILVKGGDIQLIDAAVVLVTIILTNIIYKGERYLWLSNDLRMLYFKKSSEG